MLYHGTSVQGLKRLEPMISEHGKPYVYFSSNIVVAAFYTVHRVKRPYNWFPYGFNENSTPVYYEYYENAFSDVYSGKRGVIYCCENVPNIQNPTNINCTYVCENAVNISEIIEIDDMYKWFIEKENGGELIIKRYETLSQRQKQNFISIVQAEIDDNKLREKPDCDYTEFIKKKFPFLM